MAALSLHLCNTPVMFLNHSSQCCFCIILVTVASASFMSLLFLHHSCRSCFCIIRVTVVSASFVSLLFLHHSCRCCFCIILVTVVSASFLSLLLPHYSWCCCCLIIPVTHLCITFPSSFFLYHSITGFGVAVVVFCLINTTVAFTVTYLFVDPVLKKKKKLFPSFLSHWFCHCCFWIIHLTVVFHIIPVFDVS